jgi:hypothetical protein
MILNALFGDLSRLKEGHQDLSLRQDTYNRTLFIALWMLCSFSLIGYGCTDDESTSAMNGLSGGASNAGIETSSASGAEGMNTSTDGGSMGDEPVGPSSCSTDEDCQAGQLCDQESMSCRLGCSSDLDCGPTSACINALCTPLPSCADGASCDANSMCNCDDRCVPMVGNPCTQDNMCPVSEYCNTCEGQCKPRVAPCAPCASTLSCERPADLCAGIGAQAQDVCLRACAGQGTCDNLGPGYECQDFDGATYCIPASGTCEGLTGCSLDSECPPDQFCNERQQCQPGCEEDTSCPNGQLCQGLRCAPPCTVDTECGQEGAVCDDEGRCQIPGGCQSSRDCSEAETYCDLDQLRCVSGCQVDDDCLNAAQECLGGRCRPRGCSGNYQCAFGEVCDLESRSCQRAEGRHCEADCDPEAAETACGEMGQRCLSLKDEEDMDLGSFCFEPCQPEPNACPQGYSCTPIEDPNAGEISLCVRRCDLNPVGQ